MAEQRRDVDGPPPVATGSGQRPGDDARMRQATALTAMRDSSHDAVPAEHFDGISTRALRESLGVPAIHLFARAGSTLDIAHELAAAGAPEGTLVIADMQTRGRGRAGKRWTSPPASGIWVTLLGRPTTIDSIRVLTVRLGLAAAAALDEFAGARVRVKWPNDLFVGAGKLAGILVEARWRGTSPEWLAIGFGVNVVAPPDAPSAGHLRANVSRVAVLRALVPVLRSAVARDDAELDDAELAEWGRRDLTAGRSVEAPARGIVAGIDRTAALLVNTDAGLVAMTSGSLVLSEES